MGMRRPSLPVLPAALVMLSGSISRPAVMAPAAAVRAPAVNRLGRAAAPRAVTEETDRRAREAPLAWRARSRWRGRRRRGGWHDRRRGAAVARRQAALAAARGRRAAARRAAAPPAARAPAGVAARRAVAGRRAAGVVERRAAARGGRWRGGHRPAGSGAGGRGGATGTGTAGAAGTPGALPAFPGADGAAARITGGRGGVVYHVTKLDTDFSDMRPGTLRYGLTNLTGPRTIVFDVSGVIQPRPHAVSGWDSKGNGWDTASRLNIPSNVTIAGQTAPGPSSSWAAVEAGRQQHHHPQRHVRARLRQPQLRRAGQAAGRGRLPGLVRLRRDRHQRHERDDRPRHRRSTRPTRRSR